jgi:lipopolysaccharide/colanic/teichoic acid biosynthesis glycosyltransferase
MTAKRMFDITIALVLLLLASPILLFIIIGIRATSRGPVFYRGLRTGQGGRPFYILKFRTMVVDAERRGGGTTALNDPRIFPFGSALRRSKLDELPQLYNVLRGEMSLVGPRPELLAYTDRYTPEEKMILSVRPGITDYSSIQFSALDEIVGERNADQAFEQLVLPEKNRLRLEYVRTRSFWVDITILARTAWCVVRQTIR